LELYYANNIGKICLKFSESPNNSKKNLNSL